MDTRVKPAYDDRVLWRTALLHRMSYSAKAEYPVRRGFSIPSPMSLQYWIARFRGR